jgi:hypothetical protein
MFASLTAGGISLRPVLRSGVVAKSGGRRRPVAGRQQSVNKSTMGKITV